MKNNKVILIIVALVILAAALLVPTSYVDAGGVKEGTACRTWKNAIGANMVRLCVTYKFGYDGTYVQHLGVPSCTYQWYAPYGIKNSWKVWAPSPVGTKTTGSAYAHCGTTVTLAGVNVFNPWYKVTGYPGGTVGKQNGP